MLSASNVRSIIAISEDDVTKLTAMTDKVVEISLPNVSSDDLARRITHLSSKFGELFNQKFRNRNRLRSNVLNLVLIQENVSNYRQRNRNVYVSATKSHGGHRG